MQETKEMWFSSLGWEDPLEEVMATHSSILAWETPWTEEPGGLHTVHGVAKTCHNGGGLTYTQLACTHPLTNMCSYFLGTSTLCRNQKITCKSKIQQY